MAEDRVPLFVRLPRDQAAALDRLVDSTGRRKQHLVSELLADQLAVGHIEIAEDARGEDVLTLEEAAALLRLPVEAIRARALAGGLPGRVFGEEWRFSRPALLSWLAAGETTRPENESGAQEQPRERGSRAQGRKPGARGEDR
jgi:excisionase family DNA binding protein